MKRIAIAIIAAASILAAAYLEASGEEAGVMWVAAGLYSALVLSNWAKD